MSLISDEVILKLIMLLSGKGLLRMDPDGEAGTTDSKLIDQQIL